MADSPQISVTLKNATVKGASMKKGEIILAIVAPADDANATIGDLNALTGGTFKGTVTIKGKEQQLKLEIGPTEKGPGEKE